MNSYTSTTNGEYDAHFDVGALAFSTLCFFLCVRDLCTGTLAQSDIRPESAHAPKPYHIAKKDAGVPNLDIERTTKDHSSKVDAMIVSMFSMDTKLHVQAL